MKFGMNLLLWSGELNDGMAPVLEQLKKIGYDGVEVPIFGGDPATFYTALYHALLHPHVFNDADGRYRGLDRRIHRVRGRAQYTDIGLWGHWVDPDAPLWYWYIGGNPRAMAALCCVRISAV